MSGATVRCKIPIKPQKAAAVEPVMPATPWEQKPSQLARRLALAHYIQRLIEAGQLKDYAAAARMIGLTRARLTQLTNLVLLTPELQERVLLGEVAVTERALRRVAGQADWNAQQGPDG